MVRKLGNILQVIHHAGKKRARFVFIEECKGQLLHMAEHIAPHIPLDAHAYYMPPILNDIVEHGFEQINAEQHAGPDQKHP